MSRAGLAALSHNQMLPPMMKMSRICAIKLFITFNYFSILEGICLGSSSGINDSNLFDKK